MLLAQFRQTCTWSGILGNGVLVNEGQSFQHIWQSGIFSPIEFQSAQL
jgi:hypothetical protein